MKIAWVSPLPPAASGIADYSAELVPRVADKGVEVELYTESREPPVEDLADRFAVHSIERLPERLEQGAVDLAVYQLGNNPLCHEQTYWTLREHPGVVVLHEFMLHHLVRGVTLDRGNPREYVEEHRYCAGKSAEAMAKRALNSGLPFDLWSYPLFERVVDRSLGVLVHNEFARRRVWRSRPRARVERVPLPLDLSALPDVSRDEARKRLGLEPNHFVVATFGLLTPAKRLEPCLRAFARLRRRVPEAVYLLVGEVSPHYDLDRLLDGELGEGVRVFGRLPMSDFQSAMASTDAALNLRHPTGGETSASLIRLLGLGVPTLVTDDGSFREVPDGCCAKVPLDETEEDLLTAYLTALAEDPDLRRRMGENARRHAARDHGLEPAARGYVEFLETVLREAEPPSPPVPPLAPYPREDVVSDLLADVSAAACDLGLGEEDDEVLTSLAETVVEVGLGVS